MKWWRIKKGRKTDGRNAYLAAAPNLIVQRGGIVTIRGNGRHSTITNKDEKSENIKK